MFFKICILKKFAIFTGKFLKSFFHGTPPMAASGSFLLSGRWFRRFRFSKLALFDNFSFFNGNSVLEKFAEKHLCRSLFFFSKAACSKPVVLHTLGLFYAVFYIPNLRFTQYFCCYFQETRQADKVKTLFYLIKLNILLLLIPTDQVCNYLKLTPFHVNILQRRINPLSASVALI